MLYLKSGEDIFKYYIRNDNKFIVKPPHKGADIIISDVTSEFDGICPEDGSVHFLIQGTEGGLLYLKNENGSWRRYTIFKSKSNTRKISGIRLTYANKKLCAFYALEYDEKIMLIRHIFSADELYTVPEVVDLLDVRKDFCICTDLAGNTHLFYRNKSGERIEKIYTESMRESGTHRLGEDDSTYSFTAVCSANGIYKLYTAMRKNYAALILKTQDDEEKIITFAVARNCRHALCIEGKKLIVQWSEEGRIMQAVSENDGKNFCKPYALEKDCDFSKVRIRGIKPGFCCDERGLSQGKIPEITIPYSNTDYKKRKETTKMNNPQKHNHYQFSTSEEQKARELLRNLESIEAKIISLGKSLESICTFLEKPVEFKKSIENTELTPAPGQKKAETHTAGDIGEKNEENIKLFENTDIDNVIPPKNEINLNQIS